LAIVVADRRGALDSGGEAMQGEDEDGTGGRNGEGVLFRTFGRWKMGLFVWERRCGVSADAVDGDGEEGNDGELAVYGKVEEEG
jgi:hypothetical protein